MNNEICEDSSEEINCLCQGDGWINIDEMWEACPAHYCGQLFPDMRQHLLATPDKLAEEERRSILLFKINKSKENIASMIVQIKKEQSIISQLEVELLVKNPTTKMPRVKERELRLLSL